MLVAGVPDPRGEFGEGRGKRVHGILGLLRIGDVSLHAMHGQTSGERAAAADLDRVAHRALAGWLADDAVVDVYATGVQGFDDPLGAVNRRPFFVAGDQEGDRSAVPRVGTHELLGGGDHGGEAALHVGGAATVQHTVADGGDEGVGSPLFKRPCGYDVGVSGEADDGIGECAGTIDGPGSACPRPASTRGPEILHAAITQRFNLETERREALAHDLLATGIRRRHRIAGDQVLGELERRRHGASL